MGTFRAVVRGGGHPRGLTPVLIVAVLAMGLPLATGGAVAAAPPGPQPVLSWARSVHDANGSTGEAVAVDPFGNTVVTGSFSRSATFGEGGRAVTLTASGSFPEMFLAKYDPAGQLLWAQSAGGDGTDVGLSVDTDDVGNLYVAARASGDAVFGTGAAARTVPGGHVVAEYDRDGVLQWVRSGFPTMADVAVTGEGTAYVTGQFHPGATLGTPGEDEVVLSPADETGAYLASFTADGALAWARTAPSGSSIGAAAGQAVGVGADGAPVITGTYDADTTFGTGPAAVTLQPGGNAGMFVARYSGSGDLDWVRSGTSPLSVEAPDVAVAGDGAVSVVGTFYRSLDVAAPGGPVGLTGEPLGSDAFLVTFDAGGALSWATTVVGPGNEDGFGVATRGSAGVVITGSYDQEVVLGSGASAVTLSADGIASAYNDVFVAEYDRAGELLWGESDGGGWSDAGKAVAVDATGTHVTGEFVEDATFGEGAQAFTLDDGPPGPNGRAAFVARYVSPTVGPPPAPTRIVLPERIARTGSTTVRVVGAGLAAGSTFDLRGSGGQVLTPSRVTVGATGQEVAGRFDLVDAPLATWDVQLTVPGEGTSTLADAVTTVEPTEDRLALSLSVRDQVRVGRPFLAVMSVINQGDTDVAGVPVTLTGLPQGAVVEPVFDQFDPPEEPVPGLPLPVVPIGAPPLVDNTDGTQSLPVITSRVPARGRTDLPVRITLPPDTQGESLDLGLTGCEPEWEAPTQSPDPGIPAEVDLTSCLTRVLEEALNVAVGLLPGGHCVRDGFTAFTTLEVAKAGMRATLAKARDEESDQAILASEVTKVVAQVAVSCALDILPQTKLIRFLKDLWDLLGMLQDRNETLNACLPPLPPSTRHVDSVGSKDPNDKVGPDGSGPQGFTTPEVPVDYTAYFENVPTASAAAQRVVVSDVIDPVTFDPSTIELGAVTLGDQIVATPPQGLREWSDVVEFGDPDLLLGVDVSFDEPTSTMTWVLETLDRATGLPTEDPIAGFLPPNLDAPEGEGSVRFFVEPRDRSDGVVLSNDATIVFDTNDPISTGAWVNTLDGTAPTSAVTALAETTPSTSIPVQWSAADALAGVGGVQLWVQRDGGQPEIWQVARSSTAGSATYEGVDGSTYAFWSNAWDAAGNREEPPGQPDAVTTVDLTPVPENQAPVATGSEVSTPEATPVAIDLGSDPDGDPLTYEVLEAPTGGTLTGDAPAVTYQPTAGFVGTDSFTYRLFDGRAYSDPATVTIEVTPVARGDSLSLEFSGRGSRSLAGTFDEGGVELQRDGRGVRTLRADGTVDGGDGTSAEVRMELTRLGRRSPVYLGWITVDARGPHPWKVAGLVVSSLRETSEGVVEGRASVLDLLHPFRRPVLGWTVTDSS